MPMLETADGPLSYDVVDLTPPWVDSPECVLFHHGVGIDHRIWARWWPVLAHRFRLITFDMRGYGRSAVPAPGYAWSMEGLARDALAVADAAGAAKVHFVGESLGGALAYWLALHAPERLHAIVACTAPHRGGSIDWLAEWRAFVDDRGMTAWSERMMERRFAPGALDEPAWQWFHQTQAACAKHVVLDQGEMLGTVDLSDDLGRIRVPCLMIAGDSSPFLPPPVLADTHARVPGAEMRLFNGARHGVVLSHGVAAAQTMLDFLARRASED
jgi:pimeloyl-ACP methyl ester carboxylesterase